MTFFSLESNPGRAEDCVVLAIEAVSGENPWWLHCLQTEAVIEYGADEVSRLAKLFEPDAEAVKAMTAQQNQQASVRVARKTVRPPQDNKEDEQKEEN